jgi:hypothetical protein
MTQRDDERPALSGEDEALVRRVADVYAAPALTAAQRARFDAGLERRLHNTASRRRGWLIALATGMAALYFVSEHASAPTRGATGRAALEPVATAASPEEVILAVATEPVADAEDALPEDYRAISYLVLGP